jgi:hypothetical protein
VTDAAAVARVVEEITAGYDARYSAALRTVLADVHAAPLRYLLTGPLEMCRSSGRMRRSALCAGEELAAHVSLAAERRSGARAAELAYRGRLFCPVRLLGADI